MKIAIYARTANERSQDADTCAAQAQRVKAWALSKGHEVVDIFEEPNTSGRSSDRPQLNNLLSKAKSSAQPYEAIVIEDSDRIFRDLFKSEKLKETLLRDFDIQLIDISTFNVVRLDEPIIPHISIK